METIIPAAPRHLLERAQQFINDEQLQSKEMLLDAVVRVEPQNVEAWKAYLQILWQPSRLEWVKERALKAQELSEDEKSEILDCYLWQALQIRNMSNAAQAQDTNSSAKTEREESALNSHFEMVNLFGYSSNRISQNLRRKPHRTSYNFAADIGAGMLNAALRHPWGKKAAKYIERSKQFAAEAWKNPGEFYTRCAAFPYFEKIVGAVLVILFVLGTRLAIQNYFLGYVFLSLFLAAGLQMLPKFFNSNALPLSEQIRVYMQEVEDELFEMEQKEAETKKD